jgi:acyl-CoA synthetase (AMP-forming)/AMP-acid ligase II
MLLNNLLIDHAHSQPAKAAVTTNERSITYADLHHAVECTARHFVERGLRNGDRVAVHWHNSVEYIVLMLAAFRAGLVTVPVNPRLKAAEIDYVLKGCRAHKFFQVQGARR